MPANFVSSAINFEHLQPDTSAAIPLTTTYVTGTSGPHGSTTVPGQRAVITVETANIRYRYDGGSPTTSVGHLVYAGGALAIEGQENISNFRMIAETGTADVFVTLEAE